jgi:hypothetical protein
MFRQRSQVLSYLMQLKTVFFGSLTIDVSQNDPKTYSSLLFSQHE